MRKLISLWISISSKTSVVNLPDASIFLPSFNVHPLRYLAILSAWLFEAVSTQISLNSVLEPSTRVHSSRYLLTSLSTAAKTALTSGFVLSPSSDLGTDLSVTIILGIAPFLVSRALLKHCVSSYSISEASLLIICLKT